MTTRRATSRPLATGRRSICLKAASDTTAQNKETWPATTHSTTAGETRIAADRQSRRALRAGGPAQSRQGPQAERERMAQEAEWRGDDKEWWWIRPQMGGRFFRQKSLDGLLVNRAIVEAAGIWIEKCLPIEPRIEEIAPEGTAIAIERHRRTVAGDGVEPKKPTALIAPTTVTSRLIPFVRPDETLNRVLGG